MGSRFEDVQTSANSVESSRRQLFIGALRYASLALLCAGAGSLLAKRYRLMREGICINEGLCKGCEVFETCRLPRASSAKQALRE